MLDYLKVLEENKKKNKKLINVTFLTNFNNLILNNFINYFFKKRTSYQINFLKTDYDQVQQQLNNVKFRKKIIKTKFIILAIDLNIVLNFKAEKLNSYLVMFKNYLNQIINYFPNKQLLVFNLTYLESVCFYNQELKFDIQKKIISTNYYLIGLSKKNINLSIIDIYSLVSNIGISNALNFSNIDQFKIPYTDTMQEKIAFEIFNSINGYFSIRKKCLVIDLDNTVWGGILGEIGYENLELDTSQRGISYKKFQNYLKILQKKGVILAVCSKNNYDDVEECFNKNHDMRLKLSDFSADKINWEEKYLSVNIIAKELNISKDSIVFFDDSKIERDKMKKFNPEINTIDVSDDPKNFINDIESSGFFKSNSYSDEDKNKKKQYELIKKAKNLRNETQDLNLFLKKLKMKLEITNVINNKNFQRSVQLINKTNQFNLTSKRLNNLEFKKFLNNKKNSVFLVKLVDIYGDHGYTALAMISLENDSWKIENFLLSCRILGRDIENVFLNQIILEAKRNKIIKVIGCYKKTKQNTQCKDFYTKNNFIKFNNYYMIKTKNFTYNNKIIKINFFN